MRRVHNGFLGMTAALAFAVIGVACDDTARGARQDVAEAQQDAREAAADVEAKAREEAAKARAEGSEIANDAGRAVRGVGSAIDAAAQTIDVKTALMTDATVDASDINVDTFHETRTVVLRGSVPTLAQKETAGRIAGREADGYRIDNQLLVKVR